jgi:hypothetical protein
MKATIFFQFPVVRSVATHISAAAHGDTQRRVRKG